MNGFLRSILRRLGLVDAAAAVAVCDGETLVDRELNVIQLRDTRRSPVWIGTCGDTWLGGLGEPALCHAAMPTGDRLPRSAKAERIDFKNASGRCRK